MHAMDLMTKKVISVSPETDVKAIAALLLKHSISAVPVIDADEHIVGIVSEGDLIRRAVSEADRQQSWWLEVFASPQERATDFVKSHGRTAAEVMTRDVATVQEDTPVGQVAALLEKRRIKRVPVTRDGRLVGIISRANLLHGLAAMDEEEVTPVAGDDRTLRDNVIHSLSDEAGLDTATINVVVRDGEVQLWGVVNSDSERQAAEIAAQDVPGIKSVENHLGKLSPWVPGI